MKIAIRRIVAAAMAGALALSLSACDLHPASAPRESRGGVNCTNSLSTTCAPVDQSVDMDYVLVIRNAQRAPNVVLSCYQGHAYVTGSTAAADGEGGTSGGNTITPDPSWNAFCAKHIKGQAPA